jgi:tRNA G26 N,N-dimethylase Trm1
MAEEIKQWEYRVQTVGSCWSGVKAEELEQILNEWGEEGWEVVSTHILENANKINMIAKCPLTREIRRSHSLPQ